MAEVGRNAYATTAANAAAGTPTVVAVVNDGTGDRQIVIVGDPTTPANLQGVTSGGAAKVALSDSASTGITSIADGAGQVGLGTSIIATNFIVSSVNSSTAQLAAGATFTGTIETIFNQQAISLLITSDQNGTLHLKQYIDLAGTRVISDWTFSIVAGVPYSRAFTGNGNYFNLTFQNNGGSTTTTLNINTAYGTLPATTNLGNGPVSLNEINGTAPTTAGKLDVKGADGDVFVRQATAANLNATVVGTGTFVTQSTLGAGSALVGKVGIDQTTNGTTNAVNVISRAAGGATTATLISAATTNATSVKGSAGTVYSIQASNTGAGVAFLKLYNKATAPTVGTDVAVKTLIIPAGGGIVFAGNDIGTAFGTGIAFAITAVATTADTTAVALAQVVVNIDYT